MKHYLSVADFVVIFDLIDREIKRTATMPKMHGFYNDISQEDLKNREEQWKKELEGSAYYQRLLKLREHLENLNIDIDVPEIKIKGEKDG